MSWSPYTPEQPKALVTLDISNICLCCDMLCPHPDKPRDDILPSGYVIKDALRFTPKDNIEWIKKLITSLSHNIDNRPIINVIYYDSGNNELLLNTLSEHSSKIDARTYLTPITK